MHLVWPLGLWGFLRFCLRTETEKYWKFSLTHSQLAEHSKLKIWTRHASHTKTTCVTKMLGRSMAFRNTGGSWPIDGVQSTFLLEYLPESWSGQKWHIGVLKNVEVAHSNGHKTWPRCPISKIFGGKESPGCALSNAPRLTPGAIRAPEILS